MKAGTTADHPETRALFGHPDTIPDFDKPAGTRCPHQKHHKGCSVYAKRPFGCRIWNCRWLVDPETAAMSRPNRVHYVIDMLPDFVIAESTDTKVQKRIQVVQIWIDPDYPKAINDPALHDYIMRQGAKGIGALVRLNSTAALAIIPPTLAPDRQWHILDGSGGATLPQWATWPEQSRPETAPP